MHIRFSLRFAILFSALTPLLLSPSQAAEKDHTDILFIAIDDLNDWTSSLGGHPQAETPNLDRLMARGVTFANAHCAAPACNPSRAALMSGLRPFETGVYTNGIPAAPVLKNTLTINRHFLASGFRTVGGGKIYHGYKSEGRKDTWTEWVGGFPTTGKKVHNVNGLGLAHFDWGPLDVKTEDMGDTKLTDWAIAELQKPGEKPLFLAVGYVKPHLPWYVPRKYFDRYPIDRIQLPAHKEKDLDDIPPSGIKMAKPGGDHAAVVKGGQWKLAVQGYLATVAYLDEQIGRLLDALDASPRAGKTAIVLWSDHGWHLGEKQHWRKFALWEEATRTVFCVAAPGITPESSVCEAPVDFMSVYPTVCELAGLPVPDHVKGPSLMPLLKNPEAEWDHLALCTHGRGNHGVRGPRFRYIRYANGEEELYDHGSDAMEYTNLAANPEHAEIIARLKKAIPDTEVPAGESEKKAKKKKQKEAKAKRQP